MFGEWLEEHRDEVIAAYIEIRRREGDSRPDEALRRGAEFGITATIRALAGEVTWEQAIQTGARSVLETGGSPTTLMETAHSLFLAVRQVLAAHRPEQRSEWLGIIAEYTLIGSREVAEFLSEHLRRRVEDAAVFRALADNATDGIAIGNLEGRQVYGNRAVYTLFGYDYESREMDGMPLAEFWPEGDLTLLTEEVLPQGMAGGWKGEVRQRRKDGTLFDAYLTVFPVTNEEGGLLGVAAIIRDITEQLRAERELRRMYRAVEATGDAVMIADVNGVIQFVNRAFEQITGYSREEALGKTPNILKSGRQSSETYADMWRTITAGQIWQGEVVNRRQDGSLYEAQLSISPVLNEAGEVEMFIAIQRDITEQKRAERALEEQRRFLRQVIDSSPNFVFVRDREGRFVLANRAVAEAYGTTVEELTGKTDADFNPNKEEVARLLAEDREIMDSLQEKFIPETLITGADGVSRWYQVLKLPLIDEDGVARRILGIATDITERKLIEQEIQASLERRARQVQTVTEVAQEISAAPALDELFRRVVTLIKERFGYYHSQIFRYEPALDAVVLVVGYGETGERMLAAGHQLEMGRGVVGTAAATGRPVLASDVTQDADWVPNPFLPDTKGELAVPIKFGAEVLGILDVQSDVAGALTEEDQLLLEGLCGQIAIAVESTRLRQEMEEHLKELEHLTRMMSREGWESFRRRAGEIAYLFDRTDVKPAADYWTPEMALAAERGDLVPPLPTSPQGGAAVSPLKVRGEIIGALGVQNDPRQPLSPEDMALVEEVAEQVAQALETARLFEQTQAALADVELLYQASEQIVRATTEDELLQAFVRNTLLGQMDRVTLLIFETPLPPGGEPGRVLVGAAWERDGREPQPPPGTWYNMKDFPITKMINLEEPLVVLDVTRESRLSHPNVQALFERIKTRGLAYWPLEVGQQWIGLIAAHSSQPLTLSDDEVRMISSLSDQAAAVLQGIRLLDKARENAARAQALRAISDAIIASETLDDLVNALPAVSEHLKQLVPVDVFALTIYTPGETEYTIFAVSQEESVPFHFVQQGDRLPVEGTAPGWVITHNEPWLETDIRDRMEFLEDPQLVSDGIVSRLILPMRVGGRVIGTVNIGSHLPGAFTEEHLPLQGQIADQLAMATERILLLQETRRALAEAEATHRTYVRRGWRDFLRQEEILRHGGFLYDRTRGENPLEGALEPAFDLWRPELEAAVSGKEAVTVEEEEAGRTGMAIPIVLRGQTIGVLGVEDPTGERRWSERERAMLEAIGRQLALALENARLLGETQRRAERDRLIADITARVRASMDPETILRTAVRELGAALGTDQAFVHLGGGRKAKVQGQQE